jgi:hypothetical protein
LCTLLVQLTVLLIGTQIPGAWRSSIESGLHAPAGFSSFAHLVLFAGMSWVACSPPLRWRWSRVLLFALGLALLTEGMQFVALDRHPSWRDVGIDLTGSTLGLCLAWVSVRLGQSRSGLSR